MNLAASGPEPERRSFCLRDCQHVSVCDLNGVERFLVWAIRWRASGDPNDSFTDSCLEDSFDRAGLRSVQPAFERFIEATCPAPIHCPASHRLGCWKLSRLEAHALHAIACLQSGLLGEAWKALAAVCTRRQAGRALEHLEELATALDHIGGRVARWRFDGSLQPRSVSASPA